MRALIDKAGERVAAPPYDEFKLFIIVAEKGKAARLIDQYIGGAQITWARSGHQAGVVLFIGIFGIRIEPGHFANIFPFLGRHPRLHGKP